MEDLLYEPIEEIKNEYIEEKSFNDTKEDIEDKSFNDIQEDIKKESSIEKKEENYINESESGFIICP